MRTAHPSVVGVVEVWHNKDGWSVLRTPDGLSVWCHFSQVDVDGYKQLTAGGQVCFDYETPGQDGCDGRVLTSAQPLDEACSGGVVQEPLPPSDMTGAYASHLVITFDEG